MLTERRVNAKNKKSGLQSTECISGYQEKMTTKEKAKVSVIREKFCKDI